MKEPRRTEAAQRNSFVLRLWREEGQSGWQGWLQHVSSGESVLVQSANELLAFIERHTGWSIGADRKGIR